MNKEKVFLWIIVLAIIVIFVYRGIQSGSIHLYLANKTEEKVIDSESYSKFSSGDIRFNDDKNSTTYSMPITLENNSSKLYAQADRKSFAFPNNYMIIRLLSDDDEMNYLSECRVRSGELCDFGEKVSLSVANYRVEFISAEKHTWELWVKTENLQ